MEITLTHYLVFSALLFSIGLYGALARRNTVGILMAIELMLNSANIVLVAISHYSPGGSAIAGQVFAVFIITVAAAEAAVALALLLALLRVRGTVDVEAVSLMRW